tara:strand:+ start:486 stop:686 length:201 start_codon:yes stop_codon:yes gene_type:complete
MSSDSQESSVEEKVNKIYQNYGIEVNEMSDDDLTIVYGWYRKNLDALSKDLKRSEDHKAKNGNNDE